jgi:PAS domain S-box-containing protein
MPVPIKVLIVEDRESDAELMLHSLRKDGFTPDFLRVDSKAGFLSALQDPYDLILADWSLPQFSGIKALELMKENGLDIPFILVSGSIGEDAAIQLVRKGADDYVLKDNMIRLGQAVRHALEAKRLRVEKNQADAALRESEKYYRLISENAGDVIWVLDPQAFRFTYVSPSVEKLRGYTPAEIMAQPVSAALTPASLVQVNQLLPQGIRELLDNPGRKTTHLYEVDQPCKDGSIVHTEVTTTFMCNEDGQVKVIGVSRDITDRKLAEAALRASEEKFRGVIEQSTDGIVIIDENGTILEWNRKQAEISGYEKEEFLGKPIWEAQYQAALPELKTPQLLKAVKKRIKSILEAPEYEGFGKVLENKLCRKDGTVRDIESVIYPIRLGDRRLIGSLTRDITERKQAEKALSDSEVKYRLLYSSMQEGVAQFQMLYDEAGKAVDYECRDCNPAFGSLMGIDPARIIGRKAVEAMGRVPHLDIFGSVAETGQPAVFEEDSETLHKSFNISAFSLSRGRFATIIQDITGRKEIEKTRLEAEESIRESEERFRIVYENANDAIFIENEDDEILSVNQRACTMMGYTSEELLKMHVSDLQAPDSRKVGGILKEDVLKHGTSVFEGMNTHSSGRHIPVEISVAQVRRATGDLYISILRDISERKKAQEDLNFRNILLSTQQDVSMDGILVVDWNGKVISYNKRFLEMMGLPSELMENESDEPVLHFVTDLMLDPAQFLQRVQYLYAHKSETSKDELALKDGRFFERFSAPMFGSDDHYYGRVWTFHDVTEYKQVIDEMARQKEELHHRNEELARLYRASGSLLSGALMNTQELAQKIVEVVQQEFGQDNCSLFMIQKDSNELARLAISGPYSDLVKKTRLTIDGGGLVARALRTGQVLNVANVRVEPNYINNWEGACSELAIPLKLSGSVIGAVDVQSPEFNAFSSDDERLMTIFAERAALVLEHSRLNTLTEARIQQLMALRTVDMAISGSFDINLTLGILLDQVIGQLGVHAADVLLFNAGTQNFKMVSERGFRMGVPRHSQLNLGMGYAWRAVRERRMVLITNLQAETGALSISPELSREQFVSYIGIPLVAKGQTRGVLEIFHRDQLNLDQDGTGFLEMLAGQAAIAIDNIDLFENLQASNSELVMAYDSTLEGWASALELRDHETGGHTRRSTELTVQLAQAMGVKETDIIHVYRGALLHDIGKMGVPDSIVLKPGPLTDEEWVIMRKHPQFAFDWLSPISFLRQAVDIPYCHHEKWDGSGYPRGLKGDQIPLPARIFAVVDVWDALTSDRPYRPAWPKEKTINHIRQQSGTHFDPKVVETFLRKMLHE